MPQRYEIGRIVNTHGVRGDVKIYPTTDFPERFLGMKSLTVSVHSRLVTYPIKSIRALEGKNVFLAHLEGIDTMDAAKSLQGFAITVAEDERVPLEENEYWLSDIIGSSVVTETGEELGTVTEFMQTGSNDVYVVRDTKGKLQALPAVKDVVKCVDVASHKITVCLPDGLWNE